MNSVRAKAYTSLGNLGHGFDVFGLCVDVAFDEVTLTRGGSGGVMCTVTGKFADSIPQDAQRNTAGLAIANLLKRCNVHDPVHMTLNKGTRPSSGLGSSAASAAAAVVAANELFELNLSQDELVAFAAEGECASAGTAHPDNVAAALCGGFIIATPDPPYHVISITPTTRLRLAILLPDIHIDTSRARAALPDRLPVHDYARGAARCGMIVHAIATGDADLLGWAVENSFVDRCRSALIPGFEDARIAAKSSGAVGVFVGGGGPCITAVIKANADPHSVAEAMLVSMNRTGVNADAFVAAPGPPASVMEHER